MCSNHLTGDKVLEVKEVFTVLYSLLYFHALDVI